MTFLLLFTLENFGSMYYLYFVNSIWTQTFRICNRWTLASFKNTVHINEVCDIFIWHSYIFLIHFFKNRNLETESLCERVGHWVFGFIFTSQICTFPWLFWFGCVFFFVVTDTCAELDLWFKSSISCTVSFTAFLKLHDFCLHSKPGAVHDFEYCGYRQICSQDNFCHIFLGNHRGQLPDIWHRASVWKSVSCKAFLNLRHVHFLFDATLKI